MKKPRYIHPRIMEEPCKCIGKVTHRNGEDVSFCINCLRPNQKEYENQKYYEQAIKE